MDAIAFKVPDRNSVGYLPDKYGHWQGLYNRLRIWALDGTWKRVSPL
jgi:transposase